MYAIPDNSCVYADGKMMSLGFVGQVEQPLELMPLLKLLLRSYLNSEEVGLTGVFYYDGINLGEIIEGPDWAVEGRWQMVSETHTFKQLRILGKTPISHRTYSTWSMHAKDGAVIHMLYPELIKIIDEFDTSKSIFEKISSGCQRGTSVKACIPQMFSSRPTLH